MNLFKQILLPIFSKKNEINSLLAQAMDESTCFDIFLGQTPGARPDYALRLSEIADDMLVFRQTAEEDLCPYALENDPILNIFSKKKQPGQTTHLTCTFTLAPHKHVRPILYHFIVHIKNVDYSNIRTLAVSTTRPTKIEKCEPRKDLRIDLSPLHAPQLQAWPTDYDGTPPHLNAKPDYAPLLSLSQNNANSLQLHDISAGGVKLSLHSQENKAAARFLKPDKHMLLWLSLPDKKWHSPLECLLLARVVRVRPLPLGRVELGLHFLHMAGGKLKTPTTPAWTDYSDGGIEKLMLWVHRRLAEFDRKSATA